MFKCPYLAVAWEALMKCLKCVRMRGRLPNLRIKHIQHQWSFPETSSTCKNTNEVYIINLSDIHHNYCAEPNGPNSMRYHLDRTTTGRTVDRQPEMHQLWISRGCGRPRRHFANNSQLDSNGESDAVLISMNASRDDVVLETGVENGRSSCCALKCVTHGILAHE